MAYGTDHRDFRSSHRSYRNFFVKGPQILDRTAATPHNQDISQFFAVKEFNSRSNFRRSVLALHLNRIKQKLYALISPARHCYDVTHSGTCRRGNNSHSARMQRQLLFTLRRKQAGTLQLLLQLFVSLHQIAHALLQQQIGIQLINAVTFINCQTANCYHSIAVLRLKAQTCGLTAKHYAF